MENSTTNANDKLIKIMEKRRLTDVTLAALAGVSRQTIYRLKNGKGKPDLDTLEKIAKALNKKIDQII